MVFVMAPISSGIVMISTSSRTMTEDIISKIKAFVQNSRQIDVDHVNNEQTQPSS